MHQIFIAPCVAREIKADEQVYSYRKIKDAILTNHLGVENKNNYSIASAERAFVFTENIRYKNILLIDNAVESISTINKTAG